MLSRLRRVLARALHQPRHLSRRRRRRGGQRRQRHDLRRRGQEGERARSRPCPSRPAWWTRAAIDHFMAKEIHEQPEVVGHTLSRYLDAAGPARRSLRLRARAVQERAAADHVRLRHRLSTPASSANTGSRSSRGFPSRSMSPPSCAIAARSIRRAGSRCSSRNRARPPTRWPPCAAPRRPASASPPIVNVPESSIARESETVWPHLCRSRDRRRLDQGIHLPALGAGLRSRSRRRARAARSTTPRRSASARCCSKRRATWLPLLAQSAKIEALGRQIAEGAGRALSRPRRAFPARARRRAEAEGDLLHPRRRLCRGRDEARPDRA